MEPGSAATPKPSPRTDLIRLGSVDDSLIRFYESAIAAAAVAQPR